MEDASLILLRIYYIAREVGCGFHNSDRSTDSIEEDDEEHERNGRDNEENVASCFENLFTLERSRDTREVPFTRFLYGRESQSNQGTKVSNNHRPSDHTGA